MNFWVIDRAYINVCSNAEFLVNEKEAFDLP